MPWGVTPGAALTGDQHQPGKQQLRGYRAGLEVWAGCSAQLGAALQRAHSTHIKFDAWLSKHRQVDAVRLERVAAQGGQERRRGQADA
jgi:hypothetical protein